MPSNDLFDYMREATRSMQSEYERIQKRATEDPGTAGDNGEENWAELLRLWLPPTYQVVTKGRIMNSDGDCGPQVDVLVLSPTYPKALLGKKEYLEAGVLAAFECKLTLKAEHIRSAVKNAVQIRRQSRQMQSGSPYKELHAPVIYGLLAHSHVWQGQSSKPIDNIESNWQSAETVENQHPREMLDLLCVSDLAAWNSYILLIAGPSLLSQLASRYEPLGDFWTELQNSGGLVETLQTCFAGDYQVNDEQRASFTPIGSFLSALFVKLAWRDVTLRPLAEYFVLTNLLGSGRGTGRIWPISVLSEALASKLKLGGCLTESSRWDEWRTVY